MPGFVGERLLMNLIGKEIKGFHLIEKSIIVAHDLSPANLSAMLNKEKVLEVRHGCRWADLAYHHYRPFT